jgi:cystathionine beta-lyase
MFTDNDIHLDILQQKAFNLRWAEVEPDVIPLTAADTDFLPAPEIARQLTRYISEGYFPYVPKLGLPELRHAFSDALKERKGELVAPECILPIDSAARGMFVAAKTILKPGDEMIVFDPVDFLFRESALAAGAKPVYFPAKIRDGRIDLSDLEGYISPRTRMIGLCNPHNPLGLLYSRDDLARLLELAEKHDLYIMNDEVWSDIIYQGSRFLSIMELPNNSRVLSIYGFSKGFGIAGLRAGCIYCTDPELFSRIVKASDVLSTAGGISSLSQIAALACLRDCWYWVDAFRDHLTSNRDYALERLAGMPLVSCHKPEATFVLFPNTAASGMSSVDLVNLLRQEYRVALVPGGKEYFGSGSEGHIRISIATSRKILKEGLDRLEKGLEHLQQGLQKK